jgi:uncharacterized membrane protein YgaE (UPF0421/DUF939 family)
VSWDRLVGTALGAVVGALAGNWFAPSAWVFGISIFVLGLLCAVTRTDRSAYRFAGMTLAIVLLTPRVAPVWRIAVNRFVEVAIGIAVALLMTVAWPERDAPAAGKV